MFDASYAAVPHLFGVAEEAGVPFAFDFLALPTAIEVERRRGQAADMPDELSAPYAEAWKTVPRIIASASAWRWDHGFAQCAAAALVASKGKRRLAEAISELGQDTLNEFLQWNEQR